MNNKIVLIANSNANGYGVISSLCVEDSNFYIIACDPKRSCPTFKSKYVNRSVVTPDIENNEEEFISKILSIASDYSDKIYLIPTNDTYLVAFHNNWHLLKEYFIPVFEIRPDIFIRCIEKRGMYEMAKEAGVPYPKSYFNSQSVSDENIFPVIVKPLIKTAENSSRIPFRIKKFENLTDLKNAEKVFNKANIEYVIQQFIPGEDDQLYTGGIVAIKGKVYGLGTGRKIRQYPQSLGVCAYGELVKDEKLENYCRSLITYSGVTGISQIEFKKYRDEYYLMEINPRPWLWNKLITYAGVNLAHIFIKATKDPTIEEVRQSKYVGYYSSSLMDLIYNVILSKNLSFIKWFKDSIKANIYSFGSISDPLPGIYNILNHLPIVKRFRR